MSRNYTAKSDSASLGLRGKAWVVFAFLFPILAGEGTVFRLTSGYPFLFAVCMAGLAVGCFSLFSRRRWHRLTRRLPSWFPLPLFTLWAGLSLTWSVSFDHSSYLFIPVGIGCVLFLALVGEEQSPLFRRRLIEALVASGVVLSLYAVYQVAALRFMVMSESPGPGVPMDLFLEQAKGFRPGSLFKDANTFGSFLSIVLPLNLFLIVHAPGKYKRTLPVLALILNIIGLFLVASRGPALLAILAAAAVGIHAWQRSGATRMPMKKCLFLCLGLAVSLAGIQVLIKTLGGQSLLDRLVNFEEMTGHAFAARTSYWLAALRAFLDHPWIGSGLNTLQQTLFPYLVHGTFTRFPHNIFFQLMAEIGLPGAVLFTLSILAVLKKGFGRSRNDPRIFHAALAFLVLVVYAFFDITFQCTAVIFLFFILAGMIKGEGPEEGQGVRETNEPGKAARLAGTALILLTMVGGFFAAHEAYRVFKIRIAIDNIRILAASSPPFRVQEKFEASLEKPHLLVHRAYADWLMHRYSRTGAGEWMEQGIVQRIRAYERSGKNPCDALEIGRAYAGAGMYDEAVPWFSASVDRFPSSLTAWREYLGALIRTGKAQEALVRIPTLLAGMKKKPAMEKYYAIDGFELEVMLATLHEEAGYTARALDAYRRLLRKYGARPYLESYDPIHSNRVRMPLKARMDDVRGKIKALTSKRRGK